MKRLSFLFYFLFSVLAVCSAQKKYSMYAIGFYNQENLFDTCHDEGKRDYDFLPTGSYKWNGLKYTHKLRNMARVLAEMGTDKLPYGCAFIGVSEVENAKCLQDLCNQEPLKKRNMQFVHFEGVDKRGVDVAGLYNPKMFKIDHEKTRLVPFEREDTTFFTRGFLVVRGTMAGDKVCCIVCHLPSRLRGDDFYRVSGAQQLAKIKDGILAEEPDTRIFVMGDMNDDPTDRSMTQGLRGKETIAEVAEGDMYNPWLSVLKSGTGTLKYNGVWNLFDQILLSPNLLVKNAGKDYQAAVMKDCMSLKYYNHQIFRRDYLFQTEGKYKGNPKRTHAGGQWLDGFSDHLPVVVYVVKEVK